MTDERTGPHHEAGPDNTTEASVPRDPGRAVHWHHTLVRRRRWSCELDSLLAAEPCRCQGRLDAARPIVGDPYHDWGLDLGVRERDHRGRELLAAGWTP